MTTVGAILADPSIVITDQLVAAYARIAAAGTVVPASRLYEVFRVPFTTVTNGR